VFEVLLGSITSL